MKYKDDILRRLESVLVKDKALPIGFQEALTADVSKTLAAYFEIFREDIIVSLSPEPDGIHINIEGNAARIRNINFL